MKPQLRIAYIDETVDWAEEIRQAAGRIAGVYLYDLHIRTFCCELQPSYELRLLGYLTEREVDDDIQMAMLQVTEIGAVSYINTWVVDGFRRLRRRPHHRVIDPFLPEAMPCTIILPGPFSRNHDTAMEEALEMLTQYGGFTTT